MFWGRERLPASAEMKVVLGYIVLDINRAICLGFTCLKVKPVVGNCFRYVTVRLLLDFSAKLSWKMKPFNDKLQMAFKTKVTWAACAHLASSVVKLFLSWAILTKTGAV